MHRFKLFDSLRQNIHLFSLSTLIDIKIKLKIISLIKYLFSIAGEWLARGS